jgi:uncharacterized protein (TIGR00661 family)
MSRAKELLPAFKKRAEVDVLISGMHAELDPGCEVKYRLKGLGFKFGRKGGVDYFNTWWKGDVPRFLKEISNLDLSGYDLVVNDFEPVSAWAARKQHIPCVGLSNQCVLLDHRIPKPELSKKNAIGKAVLKHYAPVDMAYGFHYFAIDPFISTPVIRSSIRQCKSTDFGHYVVYLPFYNDKKIIHALSRFPDVQWEVFSKHSNKAYTVGSINVHPISESHFHEKFASCSGVICSAGFGTTAEALFLGKKLLVIPMKNQYEQQCNALALQQMDVPVIKSLKSKWFPLLEHWLEQRVTLEIQYPDNAQIIADRILSDFANQAAVYSEALDYRYPKGLV